MIATILNNKLDCSPIAFSITYKFLRREFYLIPLTNNSKNLTGFIFKTENIGGIA